MRKINKKIIVTFTIITALALAAAYYYLYRNNSLANETDYPVNQSDGINFDPPTEEEKLRADENKKRIEEREEAINNAQQNNTGGKQTVTPSFSYIGQYGTQIEVGSYVPGIYEDGGTCTAKFSQDSDNFSRSVQALKNVASVDCPVIAVPVASFPTKGVWSVTVSYSSEKATGISDTRTVEVK